MIQIITFVAGAVVLTGALIVLTVIGLVLAVVLFRGKEE